MWVHVGDRYSDIFEFLETCLHNHAHFLVRAAQDRRVESADERLNHLFAFVRSLPAVGEKSLDRKARDKRPAHVERAVAPALSSEKRQLQEGKRLLRLLGFLAPIAARLLQLREIARLTPKRLAMAEMPKELVKLVAVLAEVPPDSLTVGDFWRHVACFGGYLGRRSDGPPGFLTLWRGWLYVQTLIEGVHLAGRMPP